MLASTLLAASLATPSPPPDTRSPPAWSLVADAGVQALGFKPFPANPTVALGAEYAAVRRKIYRLHVGAAIGGFWQLQFAHGTHLDLSLSQRFAARMGLYAGIDLVLGGQLAFVPGPRYRAGSDGTLEEARAPAHAAARVGLGLEAGFDLSRHTAAPVRLFVRYRQFAITPFMSVNDLPVMGLAAWTGGLAVALGRTNR